MSSQLEVQKHRQSRGGRPKKDPETIIDIFRLRARRKSIDQILDELGDERVSRGTVAKYTKEFDNSHEALRERYRPFEWHRLEEYGLPWESSAYLLEMWMRIQEYWVDEDKVNLPVVTRLSPTVRQVRWWWRVHLAVPHGANTLDIYFWAEHFVRREMLSEALGTPFDVADLEAYLAYKPWVGPNSLSLYSQAIAEKRIPPLSDAFYPFLFVKEIEAAGALDLYYDLPPSLLAGRPSELLEALETLISNQPDELERARCLKRWFPIMEHARLVKKRCDEWDRLSNVRGEGKL